METFDAILQGAHSDAMAKERPAQADPMPEDRNAVPTGETQSVPDPTPAAQPKADKPDDDDASTPDADVYGKVPLKALEAERAKRQDWKAKAIQAEERQRAAEEKLAERDKAPVQAQAQQPVRIPPPPSPIEDPQGFARHQQQMMQQQKLNVSEIMLRQAHEDVDAKLEVFMKAAKENPSLIARANAEAHPWGWMYSEATKLAKRAEIGDDPDAFRARIRAEVEAELRGAAPTIDVTARDANPHVPARSLAAARSAAPSKVAAPAWSGPVPLDGMVGANSAAIRKR